MGLEDLLERLAQGADAWNAWRLASGSVALDLSGAKLRRARLSRVDLRGADLTEADLDGALLFGANLCGACLRGARFYVANLCGADLKGADLRSTYLRGADLRDADLRRADLRDADFRGANLRYADLRHANLHGADLRDADLRDTDLHGVDLSHVMKSSSLLENAPLVEQETPMDRVRRLGGAAKLTIESEHAEILGEAVLNRLRQALVQPLHMTETELTDASHACWRYTQFREGHPKRRWPLLTMVAFIEAIKPHLMFRSWAAVHEEPFYGITALCESLHDLFGRDFFMGRELSQSIPRGLSFGDILQRMGAVSDNDLREARTLRAEIEQAIKVRLFLGTLLVRSSLITLGEYYQALATHYGVPFTGLNDETVERIAGEWAEFSDLQTRTIGPGF